MFLKTIFKIVKIWRSVKITSLDLERYLKVFLSTKLTYFFFK